MKVQLKINPPPIMWSPLASAGLVATLGSYLGSYTTQIKNVGLLAILLGITPLVAGLFLLQPRYMRYTLYFGLFCLFLFLSSQPTQRTPWSIVSRNDICALDCQVLSTPSITRRTQGQMRRFDSREDLAVFLVSATPEGSRWLEHQQITVFCNGETDIKKGNRVNIVGWLRESSKNANQMVLFTTDTQISSPQGAQLIEERFQTTLLNRLTTGLDKSERTLASALFFGVRESEWSHMFLKFQKAGMAHILAISGLHIAIVLLITNMLVVPKNLGNTLKILTTTTTIALLCCVIELRAPVVRAMLFAICLATISCTRLRCNSTGILGSVAIITLVINPKAGSTTSFQLSFLVVSALCVLLPQITWSTLGPGDPNAKIKTLFARKTIQIWLVGFCAWCVATPMTAHLFGSTSPSGLVSSIPAVLLLITTIGSLAQMTFKLSLSFLLNMSTFFGAIPHAHFSNTYTTWLESTVILGWFICWSSLRRKRKWLWFSAPAIIATLAYNPKNPTTTITTIHVHHGTCHIIQQEHHTVVIDAGSRTNYDVGSKTIVPTLSTLGVRKIDALFVTHADLDHLVGILDVIHAFETKKIIVPHQTMNNQTAPLKYILEVAEERGVCVQTSSSGCSFIAGEINITVLSPKKHAPYISSNASSFVLSVQTHGKKILFTGDIDKERIQMLIDCSVDADIIELPHHGEWSTEAQQLIDIASPLAVLQSTNITRHAKDQWSIPTKTTRFVTAVDGTITSTITKQGDIHISGSHNPDTMPPCISLK